MGDLGPTQPGALDSGALVKGRYRIAKHLSSGGFGAVYLAKDELLHHKRVVIKVILAYHNPDPWFRRKFENEIEALARIDHPGVVNVLDCGELDGGKQFLVMQFIDGVTLGSEIPEHGLDRRRAARILEQIGAALSAAHRLGICHRDLKPENIMLQQTADRSEHVRIIDFGIASLEDLSTGQVPTRVVGSPAYMAPEQFAGEISACL